MALKSPVYAIQYPVKTKPEGEGESVVIRNSPVR